MDFLFDDVVWCSDIKPITYWWMLEAILNYLTLASVQDWRRHTGLIIIETSRPVILVRATTHFQFNLVSCVFTENPTDSRRFAQTWKRTRRQLVRTHYTDILYCANFWSGNILADSSATAKTLPSKISALNYNTMLIPWWPNRQNIIIQMCFQASSTKY